MGAGMMGKTSRVRDVVLSMTHILPCPLTLKMRTGLDTDVAQRFAHKLVQRVRLWSLAESEAVKGSGIGLPNGTPLVAAITIHGRTRQQRYNKYADWDYVGQVRVRAPFPCSCSPDRHLVLCCVVSQVVQAASSPVVTLSSDAASSDNWSLAALAKVAHRTTLSGAVEADGGGRLTGCPNGSGYGSRCTATA